MSRMLVVEPARRIFSGTVANGATASCTPLFVLGAVGVIIVARSITSGAALSASFGVYPSVDGVNKLPTGTTNIFAKNAGTMASQNPAVATGAGAFFWTDGMEPCIVPYAVFEWVNGATQQTGFRVDAYVVRYADEIAHPSTFTLAAPTS